MGWIVPITRCPSDAVDARALASLQAGQRLGGGVAAIAGVGAQVDAHAHFGGQRGIADGAGLVVDAHPLELGQPADLEQHGGQLVAIVAEHGGAGRAADDLAEPVLRLQDEVLLALAGEAAVHDAQAR